MNKLLYPILPIDRGGRTPASLFSFNKQVNKAIGSIILFFTVYVLLLLAASGLAAACFYLGIRIIIAMPKFFTLLIGLGLMALGISILFFLIKFVFAVTKNESNARVLITEKEQPELFAFIRKLTEETKTPFPKKIYLSEAVNASVFYNSSFWSMFMPVRKNLEIGLGLVNAVNISEFKAVMAHEFGHFSQRSMKLGSFTYNVNRVIYNMLFENSSYTKFLLSWGRLHGLLSLFAGLTIKIAEGIQWILRRMYRVVNKSYLALSREMEFHADAVAANIAGGNNLITALSRIELAANCYETALNHASELLKENKISKNIFVNQLTVFRFMASDYNLPMKAQLPEVSFHFIQSFSKSRVNYKDQWASHPTLEERKLMLDQLGSTIHPDESSAWQLFSTPEKLQEQMTRRLYKAVQIESEMEEYDPAYYEEWYVKEKDNTALPALYKGFYDNRFIDIEDWDLDTVCNMPVSKTFTQLFHEENGQLQSVITRNENDLNTVRAIKAREIDVSSFDFDGVKYFHHDADEIIQQLENEIAAQKEQQMQLDKEVFAFFFQKTGDMAGAVKNGYFLYQRIFRQYNSYVEMANKTLNTVSDFYNGNVTLEQAEGRVAALKDIEFELKQMFQSLLDEKFITPGSNKDVYNLILSFNNKSYAYFLGSEFQSHELNELSDLTVMVGEELNTRKFNAYKKLLQEQFLQLPLSERSS